MREHKIDVRVYYEDTDAAGHVYHGRYLNFGERGRTDFLRAIDHQNSDLLEEYNILFVVKHIEIEYHLPAYLDDLLEMRTHIKTIKNSSFIMQQTLYRGEELISDMSVVIVTVDAGTSKPVKLPDSVRRDFKDFVEQ